MAKYIKKCICCGKLLDNDSNYVNYCDSCSNMKKHDKKIGIFSDILWTLAFISIAVAVIIYVKSGDQIKDLEKRITTLEQQVQSTK